MTQHTRLLLCSVFVSRNRYRLCLCLIQTAKTDRQNRPPWGYGMCAATRSRPLGQAYGRSTHPVTPRLRSLELQPKVGHSNGRFIEHDVARISPLPAPRLIALLAAMWFQFLIQWHMPIAQLRITMRQMPAIAIFTAIHPQLGTALNQTLIGGTLGLRLVVIHDLVRRGATFGSEVMHSIPQSKSTHSPRLGFPE